MLSILALILGFSAGNQIAKSECVRNVHECRKDVQENIDAYEAQKAWKKQFKGLDNN